MFITRFIYHFGGIACDNVPRRHILGINRPYRHNSSLSDVDFIFVAD